MLEKNSLCMCLSSPVGQILKFQSSYKFECKDRKSFKHTNSGTIDQAERLTEASEEVINIDQSLKVIDDHVSGSKFGPPG